MQTNDKKRWCIIVFQVHYLRYLLLFIPFDNISLNQIRRHCRCNLYSSFVLFLSSLCLSKPLNYSLALCQKFNIFLCSLFITCYFKQSFSTCPCKNVSFSITKNNLVIRARWILMILPFSVAMLMSFSERPKKTCSMKLFYIIISLCKESCVNILNKSIIILLIKS